MKQFSIFISFFTEVLSYSKMIKRYEKIEKRNIVEKWEIKLVAFENDWKILKVYILQSFYQFLIYDKIDLVFF